MQNKELNSWDFWKYEEIGAKHKFDRSKFLIDVPPQMNPFSQKYKAFWKDQKRKCIEGFWYEGKFMPGNLYFYVNFTKIELIMPGKKGKQLGRPFLRDIEWETAYIYLEAKGFSGFEKDDTLTCLHIVKELTALKQSDREAYERELELVQIPKSAYKKDGTFKSYVHPRDYIRRTHPKNYGKPLFGNNAKNVIDIRCRRIGKSWGSAGMLGLHNFIFDGAIDYDDYLESNKIGDPLTSETLIGAIDSKWSSDLVKKVQTGMSALAGDLNFNGVEYPSPFAKQTVGSLQPSKTMTAQFQQKLDGGWVTKGSNSKIHHRTFGDNPLAGNGTSPNLIILEEVGFFSNIIDTIAALKDATMDGLNKFGVIYMCGTSGDVGAGLSEGTQDIFFNPEKYDCLAFNDIWEDTGQVGFFVPYQFKFDEYRDNNGIVDIHKAEEIIGRKRKKLFEQRDIRKYMAELQNNPSTPSEAFITQDGNTFPTADLKEQKGFVLSKLETDSFYRGECGELVYDPLNKDNVKWVPDLKGKLLPCKYNMQKNDDTTGCIQIWEHPVRGEDGKSPWGLYLAGNDPYDQDNSTTASLGSTFIYKTFAGIDGLNHRIVAEYTARPETAKQHHENVLKLLMYYNAQCLYENERNTIMMHFRQRNKAHYMVAQPDVLKSLENTAVKRDKGVHMTASIKKDMIDCLNDWLVDEDQHGRMNLNNIYSVPLLDELINYNETGNFDRVIALLLTITLKNQNHKIRVDLRKKKTVDPFFSDMRKFFNNERQIL